MLQKNTAGKWVVFAFDITDNTAKTGDAAQITANVRIDGGAANAVDDTNPTELEDGYYIFDITAAECNGDQVLITPASSTGSIQVIGVPGSIWTSAPNYNLMGIESDGDITKVNLCATTTTNTDMRGTDSAATAASLTTAQNDLDIITGASGVNLLTATQASIDAIETDTSLTLQSGINTIGVDTSVNIPNLIATAQADLDTITDTDGVILGAAGVDSIWDEVITKAGHNVSNSAAKYLRLIKQTVSVTESAVDDAGAAATTTVFNTDLTEADDFWNDALIVFTSGSLAGQSKPILDFANTNGAITLDEALSSAPSDNDEFVIASTHIHPITQIQSGLGTEAKQDTIISDIAGISAGTSPSVLQATTIATLASQVSFTLTAGSADDDAYNDALVVVEDQSTAVQKCVGIVSDYTGSTKTVTLKADPGIFTMATGDTITVIASSPTIESLETDVAAIGGSDIVVSSSVDDSTPAVGSFTGAAGLNAATDDFYVDAVLVFTTGTLQGIGRRITSYTASSLTFVFDKPFPVVPTDTATFKIIGLIE